jgi:hypothetical protein
VYPLSLCTQAKEFFNFFFLNITIPVQKTDVPRRRARRRVAADGHFRCRVVASSEHGAKKQRQPQYTRLITR